MAPEIPGFYYDPEKKKYFKIQANHAAPPNAQYSQQAVKRKRSELMKRENKTRFRQRENKETIRKAASLKHPLVNLQREIGVIVSSRARQEQQARIQASQLHRGELHRFEPWPNSYSIRHVLRNPRSGTLIAGSARGYESSVSSSATMNEGPQGDCFLSAHLLPEPDEGGNYRWPTFSHPIRIRPHYPMSFWCSAAQPTGSTAHFAIGTSEGLHTLEGTSSHWCLSKKPFKGNTVSTGNRRRSQRTQSVHAVEWMSPDVIAAGQKNSKIFLHDLRSGGSATRLQHSDAVMEMKQMDEYRLVAAGPTSLRMYDLRFAPTTLKYHDSSKPYLTFPDFSSLPFPTFDLSTELGLLASRLALASQDCKVQLFSLQTGLQVSSPLTGRQYSSPPSCVRFEYGNDTPEWRGPHGPSLLVGTDDVVEQWTW
ncbi:Pc22g21750 [Penicillium rubens Wisconsin 54-1255]|uniref:Pc22g21750 protein n=1 Tax=Penicillium rubens (strain ATCC 28089 / DSM 1075 / NRRL 1951 / Wisconsin 54-1255) TaxID=500485 RepID=B6HSY7_PENRW|nr:Pc22g21750 [Penicillium rubens Wisconsin 54-1255]